MQTHKIICGDKQLPASRRAYQLCVKPRRNGLGNRPFVHPVNGCAEVIRQDTPGGPHGNQVFDGQDLAHGETVMNKKVH